VPEPQQYCTLFDSNYLPRGLVLYRSLERACESFVLRAVCMDREGRALLESLSLPHLRTLDIAQVERQDPELRAARNTRSEVEYCWTCTPAICRFILRDERELASITYLDADMSFWNEPAPLFDELGEGSILLVAHRNSEAYDADTGTYNVGWVTFRNDASGNAALDWWRERCIEWCYDRFEPGRFGDQKYLDALPARFEGVKVTTSTAAGLAPWNENRNGVTASAGGGVQVDGVPLIYFHHAGLRVHEATPRSRSLSRWTNIYRVTGDLVWTVLGRPAPAVLDLVWAPYVQWLSEARRELVAAGASPSVGLNPVTLRTIFSQVARQKLPAGVLRAYRRVPASQRYRIGRVLSPS
jgi:hypothetical protein